jgi:DNA-binding transcriptional LysR family regulator
VRIAGALATNSQHVALLMALAGHGIALLWGINILDEVRAGCLIRLLPDYPSQPVPLQIVYPRRHNLAPRTRVVLDFVVQQLQARIIATESMREFSELSLTA